MRHGTIAGYKVDGCKCGDCMKAHRDYANYRHRQIAYGRWHPFVAAGPIRDHVNSLQASGLGWKRIAYLADLSTSTVWKLLYGDPHRNMAPSKRVRRETAEKLLSVSTSLDVLGGASTVDSTGTRRRIQALIAIGWSQRRLAERIGMAPNNFARVLHHSKQVQASTARAVRDLYEELWSAPPPLRNRQDQIAVARARSYASARGWVPPLAWDDETIDDPSAGPAGAGYEPPRHGRLPEVAEILHLMAGGDSIEVIADRYGVEPETVRDKLARARQAVST